MKNNLVVLDVETGGFEEEKNPITQLALQVMDAVDFNTLHSYDTFVKPYNSLIVSKEALQASRVTMQEIDGGVNSQGLIKELINTFKLANKSGKDVSKPILVGHNIEFDKKFLVYLFKYHNKDLYDYVNRSSLDTMILSKIKEAGQLKSSDNNRFTLTACCERFGIALHGAHGAAADVEATKQLFIKLINQLRNGSLGNNTSSRTNSASSGKIRSNKARDSFFFEF